MPKFFCSAALLALASFNASADSWTSVQIERGPETLVDYAPLVAAALPAGFWSSGYANGRGVLLRYDQNYAVAQRIEAPVAEQLRAMPDGGVAILHASVASDFFFGNVRNCDPSSDCRFPLSAYSSDGSVRYQGAITRVPKQWELDGRGSSYLLTAKPVFPSNGLGQLEIVDEIGTRRSFPAASQEGVLRLSADRAGSGVYAAVGSAAARAQRVVRLNALAIEQWRWLPDAGYQIVALVSDHNGEPSVFSVNAAGSALRIQRLSPQGNLRFVIEQPLRPATRFLAVLASDNNPYLLAINDTERSAQIFSFLGGTPLGPNTVTQLTSCLQDNCALIADAAGGASLIAAVTPSSEQTPRPFRVSTFDRFGSQLARFERNAISAQDFQWLADASLLHIRRSAQSANASQPSSTLVRLLDEARSEAPVETAQQFSASSDGFAASALPDGGSVVTTFAPSLGRHTMTRSSPIPSLRWSRTVTPGFSFPGDQASNAERVCAVGLSHDPANANVLSYRAECRNLADGALLWTRQLPRAEQAVPRFVSAPQVRLLADQTVQITTIDAAEFARFPIQVLVLDGSTGQTRSLATAETTDSRLHVNALGQQLIKSMGYQRLNVRGVRDWAIPSAQFGQLFDDGSALLSGLGTVERFNAAGVKRWSHAGALAEPALLSGDALYFRQRLGTGSGVELLSLTDASGALRWRAPTSSRRGARLLDLSGSPMVVLAAPGPAEEALHDPINAPPLSAVNTDRFEFERFAASDGRSEGKRSFPCAADCEVLQLTTLGTRDVRVVASNASADATVREARVYRLLSAYPIPAIVMDQQGLTGSWFDPSTSGQGFVLNRLPKTRTIFGGWFTYAQAGEADVRGQRWFVLQGELPAGSGGSTELSISQTRGGAFASGVPAPIIETAGTATWRADSCQSGTLTYRFKPGFNNGEEGSTLLQRLTPINGLCAGVVATSSLPLVAAKDLETDILHGAWFDPSSNGQGFFFNAWPLPGIRPKGLFAGWFTYDPAGQGNDPLNAHWFTLQSLRTPDFGESFEMGIFQTVGGQFNLKPATASSQVGTALVEQRGCDRVRLSYTFSSLPLAGAFAGKSGQIQLQKIGGCTPF